MTICTFVPFPGSDSTFKSSINASMNENPMPDRSCSGFVVNKGNATAADVCNLIEDVKRIVYEKFQVEMEPEVKMIGEF